LCSSVRALVGPIIAAPNRLTPASVYTASAAWPYRHWTARNSNMLYDRALARQSRGAEGMAIAATQNPSRAEKAVTTSSRGGAGALATNSGAQLLRPPETQRSIPKSCLSACAFRIAYPFQSLLK
jgi:hypothetical protein